MICPACGYALSPFDKDCPRCHGKGQMAQAPGAPPVPVPPVVLPAGTKPLLDSKAISGILVLLFIYLAPGVNERIGAAILGNPTPTRPLFRWQKPQAGSTTNQSQSGTNAPQLLANCGAMNDDECRWATTVLAIMEKSMPTQRQSGEAASVWNAKMAATLDQSLAQFREVPAPPVRCTRADTLASQTLISAQSLYSWASMFNETSFLTPEGAQQFNDDYNKKARDVQALYAECAAEFERLEKSAN